MIIINLSEAYQMNYTDDLFSGDDLHRTSYTF